MSATEVKKLLKVLAIETRPLMYFSSLVMNEEGASLFFASLILKFLYLSKSSLYL